MTRTVDCTDVCGQIQVRLSLSLNEASGAGKLRHINISLLWVQEQEKLKKLVYEKVPGQDNPADLFTKGVGREKLQQFAWASGQIFLDGRAEKSLQAQGVCLLQVGIGKSGILRVSSGSDNSVNPAGNRRAPNAVIANKTQHNKSKMSELAHAEIGKIDTATNAGRQRVQRTIGAMQTSVSPDRRRSSWQQAQGGVVSSLVRFVANGNDWLGVTACGCDRALCKCR